MNAPTPMLTHTEGELLQLLVEARAAAEAGHTERAGALIDDRLIGNVDAILESDPSRTDLMFLVANIFHVTGELGKSEQYYRRVLDHEPNPLAYTNLGHICHFSGRLSEAIEYRQRLMELCPNEASVYHDLGCSLIFTGRKEEGIELLRKAVEMAPGDPAIHSTYLFRLHHMPELDGQMIYEEHRRWAQTHAPVRPAKTSHTNTPDPGRRIRVGYISPDFRTHPVAFFFEPLLQAHDRTKVEVYGYSNTSRPDQVTERLEQKFDCYRSIINMRDEDVANLIEQDKIDILVDLAGHTPGNCLTVMAQKPAPIAVTYLGYPDTTGMEQVDYRLTDELADPPYSQSLYAEKLVYLPDGFLCYRPPGFAPPIGPLPALRNGYITFGSFNNNSKINHDTISLWAQVLRSNDGSRLLIKSRAGDDLSMRENFYRQFEHLGISRERIEIHGQKPAVEYMQLYNSVDIAFDTYPYNGTTTTCDSLWMGVPVISMVERHHACRVGLSILTRLGLEFFAASTPNELVARATALAQNLEALVDIRYSMRRRMTESTLCNAGAFADSMENAYRDMWRQWCRSSEETARKQA